MAQSSGAIVARTGGELEDLKSALGSLPRDMLIFSSSLRELYIQLQLTGDDTDVQSLRRMGDHVRKQAVVYTKHVLPVVEEAMRRISSFMNYFNLFGSEDLEKCWKGMQKNIDEAYGWCKLLHRMHSEISSVLNEQAQKVKPTLEALERKKDDEQQVAKQSTWSSAFKDTLYRCARPFSATRSYFSGVQGETDSQTQTPQKQEYDNATTDLCSLVSGQLMPAIGSFLEGIEICLSFVETNRKRLYEFDELPREEKIKAKNEYFSKMKQRTQEVSDISKLCKRFIILTDQMRTDLACIPKASGDTDYADDWLQKLELKNIGEETGSHFA